MDQLIQPFPNSAAIEQGFVRRVYNWMAAGLGLSALVSFYLMQNEKLILAFLQSSTHVWGIFIAQLVLVLWLSARVHNMSTTQASFMFFLYAGLNGIALSPIFLVYTHASIVSTFVIAGGTFAVTSFYGAVTKRDLTSIGSYCIMALFGVLIAGLVNTFFIRSEGFSWVASLITVAISVGLTAYDTQKIKKIGQQSFGDPNTETRTAIMGALALYLDFVLLFVHMLRLVGKRR